MGNTQFFGPTKLQREPSFKWQKISESFSNYSKRNKVNFTMFLTIKAVKNRIVVFRKCEELQILFADFIVFP
jgi:hypothetical protein